MRKSEEVLLRELIEDLREPVSLAYSSDVEFDNGVDRGREDAADELEALLKSFKNSLNKSK